jgi:hypothetical protein
MFKPSRRIAGLIAVTAVTAVTGTGAAMPAAADAAACRQYEIPSSFEIRHSHRWIVKTGRKTKKFKWRVSAWPNPREYTLSGTMHLTRFDTSAGKKGVRPEVHFTVALSNGSTGVYKGKIDRDNVISGWTEDKFHPGEKADFWVPEPVDCA